MKNLINRVQLIGNLGREVETVETSSGSRLAKVSLATSEVYFNKAGERVQSTEWHNLVAWGKVAEHMQNTVTKGSRVAISGKLTSRSYEDKNGITKYVTEVVVQEFLLLKSKEATPF